MFFNKKKKTKLDPKVRFQHQGFTKKLEQARQYKRTPRAIPENKVDKLLSRVKLGTRIAQIGVALLVLMILYLVYVPNFLTAKNITVNGLDATNKLIAESAIRQSISDAAFYNPQHNLLLLSRDRIEKSVGSVSSVFAVNSIKKNYRTNSVEVDVTAKYARYLVADTERVFDVYNDGTLKGIAGINKDQWLLEDNPRMVKVLVSGFIDPQGNAHVLSEALQRSIETIVESYKAVSGSPLAYISVNEQTARLNTEEKASDPVHLPLFSDELRLVLQKGTDPSRTFTVIFDAKGNVSEAVVRLSNLLSQTTPERYRNLDYIDMRLENRGYICLLNAVCSE